MRRFKAAFVVVAILWMLAGCGGAGITSQGVESSVPAGTQADIAQADHRQPPVPIDPNSMRGLLRARVKHVFVLVQENHTFDQYYGLYPGTNGQTVENLGSPSARATDCQYDPQTGGCQRPFLITVNPGGPNYVTDAPDITGGNNGRYDQEFAIDRGKMDDFLVDDESGASPLGPTPSPTQIESHNESIGIEAVYDCDTIPYLWYYAKNFALFDHYFQANTGPSTPSNIQLFSGQIGQTEAAAGLGVLTVPVSGGYGDGVPISNDDNPPAPEWSVVTGMYSPDNSTFQSYASMPVLLNPSMDQAAQGSKVVGLIPDDISLGAKAFRRSISWAWYEEGLATGTGFVAHHFAPLYFDYINHANSPYATASTMRDNTATNGLIADIRNGTLPDSGVFWVKGGTKNTYGLTPADPIFTSNSAGKQYYVGDDDHPGSGDADHQVAEAYLAEVINAIAQSKYWKDSVIIVTWDDSGGFYDHLPPPGFGRTCPQDLTGPEAGYACGDGVRLPALVISPFSKTGSVVHDWADHGSVSKFIEEVFGLPRFGSLPDEQAGVKAGLSPADGNPATSDLTDALDMNKLHGWSASNPPSLATISSPSSPPHMSCASLGIQPIPAPAPLPRGFETAGYYLRESLLGDPAAVALPVRNDDAD